MNLTDQINDLEHELQHYQSMSSRLQDKLANADDRISDLEHYCEEMGKFIEYIDETHPKLRTAYEAAIKLEGAKT